MIGLGGASTEASPAAFERDRCARFRLYSPAERALMNEGVGEAERPPSTKRRAGRDDSTNERGRGTMRASHEGRDVIGEAEAGKSSADDSTTYLKPSCSSAEA